MTFILMLSQWFQSADKISTENVESWQLWRSLFDKFWQESSDNAKIWLATIG